MFGSKLSVKSLKNKRRKGFGAILQMLIMNKRLGIRGREWALWKAMTMSYKIGWLFTQFDEVLEKIFKVKIVFFFVIVRS
jgi:hypothetical protein